MSHCLVKISGRADRGSPGAGRGCLAAVVSDCTCLRLSAAPGNRDTAMSKSRDTHKQKLRGLFWSEPVTSQSSSSSVFNGGLAVSLYSQSATYMNSI